MPLRVKLYVKQDCKDSNWTLEVFDEDGVDYTGVTFSSGSLPKELQLLGCKGTAPVVVLGGEDLSEPQLKKLSRFICKLQCGDDIGDDCYDDYGDPD